MNLQYAWKLPGPVFRKNILKDFSFIDIGKYSFPYFYMPVFRRDVLWYSDTCMSVRPSVRSVFFFFTYFMFSLIYQTETCFVAYLWASLGCRKISYHSDISCWK
jgi:hypothetical protein